MQANRICNRFISEDPIDFKGGDVNLFGYVGNNPINKIDPLGLDDLDIDDVPSITHELNPKGLGCNFVCNLGGGLVSTSLGLSGVGATITVPVWIASRGFCAYICPPVIKQCEIKK